MYKHFLTSVLLVFFMLSCSKLSPFEGKMRECVQTSLSWRNDTTGIWETAGWWNSANVLTATIRYGAVTKDPAIPSVIEDVFEKARHYQVGVDSTGTPRYCDNFINDYYDDEGWWALAWIEASKLTGEKKYLDMAEIIFDDMTTGWSDACGGGIFWKKNQTSYPACVSTRTDNSPLQSSIVWNR
jgi:predicted alpha-1,6-mannanase (GH76 family)